jgi:hypothetical protein
MARGYPDFGRVSARQRYSETVGAKVYEQEIAVPASTAVGAPVTQNMVLEKGEITWMQVRFPAGPANLLKVAIFDSDGATQLWPGGSGTWISGDNEAPEWDTEFTINAVAGVYKLVLKGYNDDDTYPHTAKVRAWVVAYPS